MVLNISTCQREGGGGGEGRYAQGPANGFSRKLSTGPDPYATRLHNTFMGEYTCRAVTT